MLVRWFARSRSAAVAHSERIAFGHDLIRQVVLRSVPAGRLSKLHLTVAEDHMRQLQGDPTRHAAIADHLARAGPDHGRDASHHWVEAARHASARLAYEEAAACYVRARQLDDADPVVRCRLLLDEGSARIRAGALPEGRSCFNAAAEMARETGRVDLLAEAALGLGVGESGSWNFGSFGVVTGLWTQMEKFKTERQVYKVEDDK